MLEKFENKLNKVQKLYCDKGVLSFAQRCFQLIFRLNKKNNLKETLRYKKLLLQEQEPDKITKDIESLLSKGIIRKKDDIRQDIKTIPAKEAAGVIEDAENILNKKFTIYGDINIDYTKVKFTWVTDPVNGILWDKDFPGKDIKNIWELARFQFLSTLAQAYMITGDSRFSYFASEMIDTWITENPFPRGPHWLMPMENSIRLINWCFYLPLLDIDDHSDRKFIEKISNSILEHLIFIRYNLEYSVFKENNHYLSNIVALITAQLIFPSFEWAIECTSFALKEFEQEINNQFDETGINIEGSIPYHRLSSEMSFVGIELIKKIGLIVSSGVKKRLKGISDFTNAYTSLSTDIPVIGDNDSGVFLKYFQRQGLNNHKYLNYLLKLLLKRDENTINYYKFISSINFSKKQWGIKKSEIKRDQKEIKNEIKIQNYDGLIIGNSNNDGFFYNTLNSSMGHTHNDKLSIYPVIEKSLLFVDRGSFSYTGYPDKRHKDRMASSHNGPVINGWEQNRIWKHDLFYISNDSKCNRMIEEKKNEIRIIGWHNGYSRFSKGMKVYREIIWTINNRTIFINDWVVSKNKTDEYHFSWNFLINPIWNAIIEKNKIIFNNENKKVIFQDIDKVGLNLEDESYSPNYLQEMKCKAIKGRFKARSKEKIRYKIIY